MLTRGVALLLISLTLSAGLMAEGIGGTVVIRKRLTKRRVTASVPIYDRGPAVELDADSDADPIAFERSRVAVYVEGQVAKAAPDQPMAVMEQLNRRFSPETLVVQAGSKVSFPNHDPIFHNVFSLSGVKTFDLGNYPKGDTRVVTFPAPGIVYVNCHLHSNMTATIVVAPNRWYTKADPEGHFALQDLPPGKYTVVAWHKTAGFFRQQVEVGAGGNPSIEFLIPLDENGHKLEPHKLTAASLESKPLAAQKR